MYLWGPLVLLLTFVATEYSAWFNHKYIMHGFLWKFHKDHHQPEPGPFEKNDIFFLLYAIPSWLLIMLGIMNQTYFSVWVGFGIAAYGLAYFLFHDVYIHRRFKFLDKLDGPYLMAIRKAHKVHHKERGKKDAACFGMLIVPMKYYHESRKAYNLKRKRK